MSNHYRYGQPTIGVLVGWHVYWTPTPYSYLNAIFRGVNVAVNQQGCNLLIACGMGSPSDRSDSTRPAWPTLGTDTDFVPVGPWNTDGLIVVNPLVSPTLSHYIHGLRRAGHPVVFIADGEGEPAILADNAGGIAQAIGHLIEHGHHRIAYIAGSSGDVKGDSGDRIRAYQAGVKQFGLAADPGLFAYGYHTFEGGYAAMRQILASKVSFTAVLASNDESAMGAMQALSEAGLKVPQDVAIIGFDDRPEAVAQEPPLTSVHVPLYKLGYQAVEVLLQHIQGKKNAPQSLQIGTRLAVRQSCGCHSGPQPVSASPITVFPTLDLAVRKLKIAQAMTESVLDETQRFNTDEVQTLCQRLTDAFISSLEKEDPSSFQELVDELLRHVEVEDDDAHIWQAAISILRREMPALLEAARRPEAAQFALDI